MEAEVPGGLPPASPVDTGVLPVRTTGRGALAVAFDEGEVARAVEELLVHGRDAVRIAVAPVDDANAERGAALGFTQVAGMRRAGGGLVSYLAFLPAGEKRVPILQARGSLKWDISPMMSAIGWMQFRRDNNMTRLELDPSGTVLLRSFISPNFVGYGLAMQARF